MPLTSFADADLNNKWFRKNEPTNASASTASAVACGQTVYYFFGPGTVHVPNGTTSPISIECENGADLVFLSSTLSSGGTGSIDLVYQVVGTYTTFESVPMANSDVIEDAQLANTSAYGGGSSNPVYGLNPGIFWVDYTASATANDVSIIRIKGR